MPEDFMPAKPKPPQTPEDMQNILLSLNAALGGELIIIEE